jgi:hypothetical protein
MPPLQHPPIPVRWRIADPPQGHIEEVPKEPPEQPEAPGDPGDDSGGDDGKGDHDPNPDPDPDAADPIPNPDPNAEADGKAQVGWLLMALEWLAELVEIGPQHRRLNFRTPIHSMVWT